MFCTRYSDIQFIRKSGLFDKLYGETDNCRLFFCEARIFLFNLVRFVNIRINTLMITLSCPFGYIHLLIRFCVLIALLPATNCFYGKFRIVFYS